MYVWIYLYTIMFVYATKEKKELPDLLQKGIFFIVEGH